jgi:NADH-quinone oxidoreductase subunit A
MNQYIALLIYLIVSVLVVLSMSFASEMMGPNVPGGLKKLTYESGIVPEAPVGYFSVRFYRVAMLFMIFDVAIMALYPWATTLSSLKAHGFYNGLAFFAIMAVAFVYVWRKGGFQWH